MYNLNVYYYSETLILIASTIDRYCSFVCLILEDFLFI